MNECVVSNPCAVDQQRVCMNTIGSYTCNCDNGYSEVGGACKGEWSMMTVFRTMCESFLSIQILMNAPQTMEAAQTIAIIRLAPSFVLAPLAYN